MCAAIALVLLVSATSAHAQLKVEVAPAFGGYFPTRTLPAPESFYGCPASRPSDCPPPPPPHALKQAQAGAAGGRIAVWFNHRSALEATLCYARSDVTDNPAYQSPGAGAITMAGLRYVFRVDPDLPILSLLLLGGPAIVHRSGEAWAGVTGTTSPAFSLGIGIDALPASRVGLRGEVSDYLYNVKLSGQGDNGNWYEGASAFQQDLIVSLALSLRP
jgi:hypothetical protein